MCISVQIFWSQPRYKRAIHSHLWKRLRHYLPVPEHHWAAALFIVGGALSVCHIPTRCIRQQGLGWKQSEEKQYQICIWCFWQRLTSSLDRSRKQQHPKHLSPCSLWFTPPFPSLCFFEHTTGCKGSDFLTNSVCISYSGLHNRHGMRNISNLLLQTGVYIKQNTTLCWGIFHDCIHTVQIGRHKALEGATRRCSYKGATETVD